MFMRGGAPWRMMTQDRLPGLSLREITLQNVVRAVWHAEASGRKCPRLQHDDVTSTPDTGPETYDSSIEVMLIVSHVCAAVGANP